MGEFDIDLPRRERYLLIEKFLGVVPTINRRIRLINGACTHFDNINIGHYNKKSTIILVFSPRTWQIICQYTIYPKYTVVHLFAISIKQLTW